MGSLTLYQSNEQKQFFEKQIILAHIDKVVFQSNLKERKITF